MERAAYLPFSTGMIRAYAETKPDIRANYEFAPFFYHVDSPTTILAQYRDPGVAAFSCWMWNEQLCLTVAKEVKRRWPNCLIIFGGLQVPQKSVAYMQQHPFIDVAARADGENPFTDTLLRNIETRDFDGIDNITWRARDGEIVENATLKHGSRDIDEFQSPYLGGLFENIMDDGRFQMQATVETVRGCPFPCSFCAWGNDGLFRKFRYHSIERFRAEIEWAASHKIKYVFNADSNFGMHQRDEEIAQILVDTKTKYGYPEKFRTCFGKNADERIYGIAKKLHDADMEKGITLALQSNTPEVLKNINRTNIKMETYQYLQRKFNEASVPVYSELILGMPGETYESWKVGIEKLLAAGLQNQLFVYLCQILPNTEMADPAYRERHGIVAKRIELNEIHGAVRSPDLVTEYEDVIVGSRAMSAEAHRKMLIFSWFMMTFHSLKIGFYLLIWMNRRHGVAYTDFIEYLTQPNPDYPILSSEIAQFNAQADKLLSGQGRGRIVDGYAPIYWDEEEASFLRIIAQADAFYIEMRDLMREILMQRNIDYDYTELMEVIAYQQLRIPTGKDRATRIRAFAYNVPEYFERALTDPVALEKRPQIATVTARQFDTPAQFAKETLLWGRKSGTIMNKVEWEPALRR